MAKAKSKATPVTPVTALAPVSQAIAIQEPITMFERLALDPSVDVAKLMALIEMKERIDAIQAVKQFDASIAAAHQELPTISKTAEVDFTTSKGRTHYRYEDLALVTEAVSPVLGKHGLSYRWRTNSSVPGVISVTCILSHAGGHREETTLTCRADETGNKNDIQAIGSAVTYLQRYTLKAAIGIAAGVDDDGRTSQSEPAPRERQERSSAPAQQTPRDHAGDKRPITVVRDDKGRVIGGQLGRLFAIAKGAGRTTNEEKTALRAYVVSRGFASYEDITREAYDGIIAAIQAPGALPGVAVTQDREPGSDG